MNKKKTDIGARSKLIFKSLVESYLKTGEPMGSKALSSKISYKLSPATIRNVLNEINFHGLIQKGHFSAGSIPTDLGLQFYTHECKIVNLNQLVYCLRRNDLFV